MKRTKILLTNDDGPASVFFQRWVELLHNKQILSNYPEDTVIVIPDAERSYVGKMISKQAIKTTFQGSPQTVSPENQPQDTNSTDNTNQNLVTTSQYQTYSDIKDAKSGGNNTHKHDIASRQACSNYYRTFQLDCSPASCTNIGVHSIFPECQVVISGPNVGHNVGLSSVLSSGTVGAALEGHLSKKLSFALSFACLKGFKNWVESELDWNIIVASQVIRHLLKQNNLQSNDQKEIPLYNINVPVCGEEKEAVSDNLNEDELKKLYVETFIERSSGHYGPLYKQEKNESFVWKPQMARAWDNPNLTEGSDVFTVKNKMISVTKLHPTDILTQ